MDPLVADNAREVSALLREAEHSVRVLRTVGWTTAVKERFFARGGRELPEPVYPRFDAAPVLALVQVARGRVLGEGPVARWLLRIADAIETSARMLAGIGTREFLDQGLRLYGRPDAAHDESGVSSLELARAVDVLWNDVARMDLGAPPSGAHTAEEVAEKLRDVVRAHFGAAAPEVIVADELSANALARPGSIRVWNKVRFTDRDVQQLVQHEAYVHVCTSLNGQAQAELPILGASHQGTTRTQEGLAVFAELVSGTLEPDRFRKLAGRILAIQMSIEGADFLDVYRFFLERGLSEDQAYESARRVFRGGVLTGGAPFVKDAVYLDGLLRVTNFLRSVVAQGRADCLLLLFCGKLDLEDVPALSQLAAAGLCRPPRFLPPWAADRRFLVAYLTYSRFLNRVRLDDLEARYRDMLAETVHLEGFGRA